MKKLLKNLLASFRRRPDLARRARLNVERLEAREALSAAPLALPGPTLAPALVAPALHADSTGGLGPIATPDRPVHGYKWRRPHPWVATPAAHIGNPGGALGDVVIADTLATGHTSGKRQHEPLASHQGEVFLHLAAGGTDGPTALTGHGLVVVRLPEGPLPTEALAAVK
jgi:hypothetical protein